MVAKLLFCVLPSPCQLVQLHASTFVVGALSLLIRVVVPGLAHLSQFRRREIDGQRFDTPPGPGAYNFLPATDDINAPDMYIPLMAFITYVLIVGFYVVC